MNKSEALCYLNHWSTTQAQAVELLSNPAFTQPFSITANLWDSIWVGVDHIPPNAPADMYTVYVTQCGSGVSQLWVGGGKIYSIVSNGAGWNDFLWVGPLATSADLVEKVNADNGTTTNLDTATTPGGYTWYDGGNQMGLGAGALFSLDVSAPNYASAGASIVQELTCTFPAAKAGSTIKRTYYAHTGWTVWVLQATATPPQEYDLPLEAGVTRGKRCAYSKAQDGLVVVRFSATFPAATSRTQTIGTLPAGYRSRETTVGAGKVTHASGDTSTSAAVELWADGKITVYGNTAGFTSASGVLVFYAD